MPAPRSSWPASPPTSRVASSAHARRSTAVRRRGSSTSCPRCGTWLPDEAASCSLCGLVLRPGAAASAPAAPAVVVEQVTYAGFWRRFWAVLIDAVVTYFPIATVRVVLGLSVSGSFDPLQPAAWWSEGFELLIDWL